MVRWVDGFYGGMVAGVMSGAFYALSGAAWLHDLGPTEVFDECARAIPPLHAASASWALSGLGMVLYLLLSAAFGIAYALVAARARSAWAAPTSVLWGASTGALVWWLVNAVLVPLTGAVAAEPLWTTLIGSVLFYGIVLSEAVTLARRRARAALPLPG